MKILNVISILLLSALCCANLAAAPRDPSSVRHSKPQVVLGTLMPKDTTGHHTRRLDNRLIAPKGEFQTGMMAAYASFKSEDSELFLALKDIDASASAFRITPFVGYTYKDNQSIGVRFAYTTAHGALAGGTADLLNEGLEFGGDLGLDVRMWAFSAELYHRSYIGLDNHGRVGIICDFVLGYTLNKSMTGNSRRDYSLTNKAKLSFNPGIAVYPMNNVSVFVTLGMADVSYNNTRTFENRQFTGERNYWDARCKINLFDINFGLTFHL